MSYKKKKQLKYFSIYIDACQDLSMIDKKKMNTSIFFLFRNNLHMNAFKKQNENKRI